ncbi:hypothetical protein [Rubrivirga sp. IMCC45206]|uniref:hypothetical protein n=1 Tax=Rubrivirga sp. IMCC45206 TaxID=3391614 RepID=UPI00398FF1E6
MSAPGPVEVVVSGIGVVTSVGRDAATACASVRAGIERPAGVEDLLTTDPDEHQSVPAVGHPVRPITDGFVSVARWLQLAPLAVRDLVTPAALPPPADGAFWRRTGLVALLADLREGRWDHDPLVRSDGLGAAVFPPLRRALGQTAVAGERLLHGRTALFRLLAGAGAAFAALDADRLVVVAVDSLLDEASLLWLAGSERLRTAADGDGLSPGEGAVALLLETRRAAAHRGATPLAEVVGAAAHPPPAELNIAALGRALATVLTPSLRERPDVLRLDMNGEPWRAKAYGHAFARLPADDRPLPSWSTHATSVGDLGAAAPAFDVALAARAVADGRSAATGVAACEGTGAAGACTLSRSPLPLPRGR